MYSEWEEELCEELWPEELDFDDEEDDLDELELELEELDDESFEHFLHGFHWINLFDGFPLSIQSSKSISSQNFLPLQYRLKTRLIWDYTVANLTWSSNKIGEPGKKINPK